MLVKNLPLVPGVSGKANIMPNRPTPIPERVIAEVARTLRNRISDKKSKNFLSCQRLMTMMMQVM